MNFFVNLLTGRSRAHGCAKWGQAPSPLAATRAQSQGTRRGVSIPAAIVSGGFLATIMFALSMFSQQEVQRVKAFLGKASAEGAAFSGIMWSYSSLCERGRWYQPGRSSIDDRTAQWKNQFPDGNPTRAGFDPCGDSFNPPFAADSGMKIQLWFDEYVSTESRNIRLSSTDAAGKVINTTVNKGDGFRLLDHIKVLSLGTYQNEKCLYFGKFIMMPEPLLNSNSTCGNIGDEETANASEAGPVYAAKVPEIVKTPIMHAPPPVDKIWSQDWPLSGRIKIKNVLKKEGDKVRLEDFIVTANTEMSGVGPTDSPWATQEPKFRARFDGTIKKIFVKPGDVLKEGDPLFEVEKDKVQISSMAPLRKMVRITRIPAGLWEGKLDPNRAADREKIYAFINDESKKIKGNHAASRDQLDQLGQSLNAFGNASAVTDAQMANLPDFSGAAGTRLDEGMNLLMTDMLAGFYPPGALASQAAEKYADTACYRLNCQPREVTTELRELLEIHGKRYHNNTQYYIDQLETEPRKRLKANPTDNLYLIKSDKPRQATKTYQEAMKGNPKAGTDDFVKSLTYLKDAAVKASIYLNEGTPLIPSAWQAEVAAGKITDPQEWFRWKNPKGEDGYWHYAPETAIKIEKVDVAYYYENNVPLRESSEDPAFQKAKGAFRMRMDQLLKFFRKHFDECGSQRPPGELRIGDDLEDTPQGPPPPDATGAYYNGLSS